MPGDVSRAVYGPSDYAIDAAYAFAAGMLRLLRMRDTADALVSARDRAVLQTMIERISESVAFTTTRLKAATDKLERARLAYADAEAEVEARAVRAIETRRAAARMRGQTLRVTPDLARAWMNSYEDHIARDQLQVWGEAVRRAELNAKKLSRVMQELTHARCTYEDAIESLNTADDVHTAAAILDPASTLDLGRVCDQIMRKVHETDERVYESETALGVANAELDSAMGPAPAPRRIEGTEYALDAILARVARDDDVRVAQPVAHPTAQCASNTVEDVVEAKVAELA